MSKTFAWSLLLPIALYLLAPFIVSKDTALWVNVLFSMALVVPLGPMPYRLVYQPVAEASVLVLLIISVAVHFALTRSEEHTSELQSLMRISYAVFCLKKKK